MKKCSAAAKPKSRLLPVRAIPKVTVVRKPPSIIHPVVRVPVERPRGKASALRTLGEQEAFFRFASRHSAAAAMRLQENLDGFGGRSVAVVACCKICRTIACSVLACPCCIETCDNETLLRERRALLREDSLVRNLFEASGSHETISR